jgi:hypothetical protein
MQRNNVKIMLGNRRKKNFRPYVGKENMHNESNENGLRAIDFAVSMNMKISSTFSPK